MCWHASGPSGHGIRDPMYRSYFGLRESPFAITPDPRFLFLSERHREALAHLLYGVGEEGGFVQLTGEVGTGKTTLCRSLLEQAPGQVDVALILNPRQTAPELLASICEELGVAHPTGARSVKVLVDCLNRHLLDAHTRGRRTVLVIDEAQSLSGEVLEQVRLLTNLETTTHKLLQILLIGQPELQSLMARPELRQLAQRVTARYHLTPLSRAETGAYIEHRLEVAGASRRLFTRRAVSRIHRLSGGVPRRINILCDRALLGAYALQRDRVGAGLVRRAAREVDGSRPGRVRRRVAAVVAAILLLAVGVAVWQLAPRGLPRFRVEYPPPVDPAAVVAAPEVPVEPPSPPPLASAAPAESATVVEPPSPAPAAEPEPEPPGSGDLALLLDLHGADAGLEPAFRTLFRHWGLDYGEPGSETACERAASAGLRCLYRRGNWTSLSTYDRPAVLELVLRNGETRHVVVSSLGPETVTLDLAGLRRSLPRAAVEPFWLGGFILLWRPPPGGPVVLQEGSVGPAVAYLRERLDRAGVSADAGTGPGGEERFDRALTRRVLRFQRNRSLEPDGVVGTRTWMQLNGAVGEPPVPVLGIPPPPEAARSTDPPAAPPGAGAGG